jgi:hypothetical protein
MSWLIGGMENRNRLLVVAGCTLVLVGCGRSRGSHDAGVDRVGRGGEDVAEPMPDAPRAATPEVRPDQDSAPVDASLVLPERDASASGDAAADAETDGPALVAATCKSWELAGPARRLAKFPVPSVRSGDRYAVLSTVYSRTDRFDTELSHYAYSVELSWFDPQTMALSDPVLPFRFQGYDDAGVPIDFGTASPAAITTTPQGFAIVWTVYRQNQTSLYFALLDDSGHALSQPVMLEARVDRVGDVVWDGSQIAVLWSTGAGPLRLGRLDKQGNLLGTTDLSDRTFLGPLRLFWDGGAYGVFWENSLPNLDEVWFAHVGQDGSVRAAPVQLSSPDCYAGTLEVESVDEGYLTYWQENPRTAACVPQSGLRRFDKNGQAQGPVRSLSPGTCQVSSMGKSGVGIGFVCSNGNALVWKGLTDWESASFTPALPVGLPKPTTGGIQVANVRALYGDDTGFDLFWSGTLDSATWDNYFSQIRCAR